METLKEYFSHNSDCDISSLFYKLSQSLKIIHSNEMIIPVIDSNHIKFENDRFSFLEMKSSDNIEDDKKRNIRELTKLFLGTYVSLSTGFYDFSHTDTKWFEDNLEEINKIVTNDDYLPQYFSDVLLNNSNIYYCDYVDNQRKKLSGGKSESLTYRKILSSATSGIFNDDEPDICIDKKTAFVNYLFYPTIFLSLLLVGFVIYTCFKYIAN